jgi:hypothetical protein
MLYAEISLRHERSLEAVPKSDVVERGAFSLAGANHAIPDPLRGELLFNTPWCDVPAQPGMIFGKRGGAPGVRKTKSASSAAAEAAAARRDDGDSSEARSSDGEDAGDDDECVI